MTIWNVAVPVVDLIEADSREAALKIAHERLYAAGFQPYDGDLPEGEHAFESEDQAEQERHLAYDRQHGETRRLGGLR